MSRLPGPEETFGRYRLERELGQGGMGVVHAAVDTVLGRRVALKIVAPHLARDEEFRTRFAREAATQARLDSAHVVRIYDHGEHDGILYISTQLVDGVDLATLVAQRGALDPEVAVSVTGQLLAGLADAHRAGVVHRDVKPANVLVTDEGHAFLCDFGIATTAGQSLTRTGQVIGSLPWMAPERHYGRDAGPAGDIYSAGCLFWFALTGAAPYAGSDGEVMLGHLEGLPPQLVGGTPFARKANAVLLKALAKEPADRYTTAADMAADLRELTALGPIAVQPAEAAPTTVRGALPGTAPVATSTGSRRARWAFPALAMACLLAAVAGGLGVRALTSEDPALVAGATTIEVAGRTVTMQPTRTLSPLSPSKPQGNAAGGGIGTDAGLGVGDHLGGDVDLGLDGSVSGATGGGKDSATSGGTSGSRSGSTSGGTTATRTQAAAPADRFRCWNGTTEYDLSSCGWPTGSTGVHWMVSGLTSCWKPGTTDARIREGLGCYAGGHPVYVQRASSVAAARSLLQDKMTTESDRPWYTGGVYAGQQIGGMGAGKYRWGRYWKADDRGAWYIFVSADTAAKRQAAVDAVAGNCRHVNHIQGVPL